MDNRHLETILNQKLDINAIRDYAPNGLQVEGKKDVKKIITGVTACQALLDYAVSQNADAIIVHHGYFWKNEDPRLIGMKGKRIKTLMQHDINLYAYHLPLDVHPELGNNAQLAMLLGLNTLQPLEDKTPSIPMWGEFDTPISPAELQMRLQNLLGQAPLTSHDHAPTQIKRLGLCTGGGQDYIDLAALKGMDAYLTGEVSERTIHSAREQGIHFYAGGHHATERYGIMALGKWLAENYDVDVEFKDIPNPA